MEVEIKMLLSEIDYERNEIEEDIFFKTLLKNIVAKTQ